MKDAQDKRLAIAILLAGLVAVMALPIYAGDLQPPAPPKSTMKTLDEVEPRIPIRPTDLPLTINQPGSYYLTESITFTGTADHAIAVESDDVTIDLMGYTLKGPDSGYQSGIYINGRSNVEIRNGTVRDFYDGIENDTFSGSNYLITNVRAISNLYFGICLYSSDNIINNCIAAENGSVGISAGTCSAVTNSTSHHNGARGIHISSGTVSGNKAYNNETDGIFIISHCRATDNICRDNGYNGDGAGICAQASDNHITHNHLTGNDRGLEIKADDNRIANNTVKDNTDNYDIAAGNRLNILLCDVPETIEWPAMVELAGSLEVTETDVHGITVDSNDVTIDLMGHTLKGPDTGTGSGIYINGRSGVKIRNGTVTEFNGEGIYGPGGYEINVIDVKVSSNGASGIDLTGTGHLIKDCTISHNGHSATGEVYGVKTGYASAIVGNVVNANNGDGIFAASAGTITGNNASYNANRGIYAEYGCTLTGNTAHYNDDSGIHADAGCTLTANTTYWNKQHGIRALQGCNINGNTTRYNLYCGITAGLGCAVTGNTACNNNRSETAGYAGIYVSSDCLVKGNTLRYNTLNNIYVNSSGNAIEENLVTGSVNGIYFNETGNFYANNRASNNTTADYANTTGNTDGGGNVSF